MFDRQAKFAFVLVCVTLLACSVALPMAVRTLNFYLKKEPVYLRQALALIPKTLGPWRAVGEDRVFDDATIDVLGTEWFVDRTYVRDQDVILVHIAYYTGMIDAVPHVPDRCMVAAGFNAKTLPENLALPLDTSAWSTAGTPVNRATSEPYPALTFKDDFRGEMKVLMPVGDIALRVTEFEQDERPDTRYFGGYFFIANGRATATPEGVRIMAFDLSERYAYYCKVQFVHGSRGGTREEFLEKSADLLNHLLPELMRRLPDWSEVEAAATGDPIRRTVGRTGTLDLPGSDQRAMAAAAAQSQ